MDAPPLASLCSSLWSNDWLYRGTIISNANSTNTDMDGYNNNFPSIRQCYLVKENIDKVKDMSADEKAVVKAEMQALIAYLQGLGTAIRGAR